MSKKIIWTIENIKAGAVEGPLILPIRALDEYLSAAVDRIEKEGIAIVERRERYVKITRKV